MYPDLDYKNNNFHQDHLHPAATFNNLSEQDQQIYGWRVYNSIMNLQMLDANENMSKNMMSLQSWVEKETTSCDLKRFMESHIIPQNISLELDNFTEYITFRKEILMNKLKSILK